MIIPSETSPLSLTRSSFIPPGTTAPGKPDRNRRTRAEVPGAADDLARLRLAHVDLAELQAIGVRMLPGLEHTADAEVVEVAFGIRDAAPENTLGLGRGDGQASRQLLGGGLDRDVFAQPGVRNFHRQNWREKRRSFSQRRRMSGTRWRSRAIRSSPSPKANPDTRSGS